MVQESDIQNLLHKHDYEVSLNLTESGEIVASFPMRQEQPFCAPFSYSYSFEKEGVVCHTDDIDELVKAPKYAYRLIVISDVIRTCSILGYEPSLVLLYEKGKLVKNKDEFRDKMYKLSERNKVLENTLESLLEVGLQEGFNEELREEANNQKVYQGFKIVEGFLTGDK
jgi:hypothetical protein